MLCEIKDQIPRELMGKMKILKSMTFQSTHPKRIRLLFFIEAKLLSKRARFQNQWKFHLTKKRSHMSWGEISSKRKSPRHTSQMQGSPKFNKTLLLIGEEKPVQKMSVILKWTLELKTHIGSEETWWRWRKHQVNFARMKKSQAQYLGPSTNQTNSAALTLTCWWLSRR